MSNVPALTKVICEPETIVIPLASAVVFNLIGYAVLITEAVCPDVS